MRHEREITAFAAHELAHAAGGPANAGADRDRGERRRTFAKPALRQILVAVDRTTRLVRQLLAMAKLDSTHEAKQSSVNIGD